MTKRTNLNRLVECAILLAAAAVLSFIKGVEMPLGGSVTAVSMLPIVLAGYRNGWKWGLLTGVTYAVFQIIMDIGKLMSWGLTPAVFIGSLVFDYLLAFGLLGIGGIFNKKKYGIFYACAFTITLRFLMHFLSGILFFGSFAGEGYSPLTWSIAYNGTYMLPELILTLIVAWILTRIPHVVEAKE